MTSNDPHSDKPGGEHTRIAPPAGPQHTRLAPQPFGVEPLTGGATATTIPTVGVGSVIKQRFELTRCLGQGGMSVVYQALDRRKLEARDSDPYIAIKVLSPEVARHPQALVALQRETSKSQQLAHPNIITVFDFDRDGDTVFMTMEQLQGESLAQLIERHPRGVPLNQARAIIQQICSGLAYAHAKHIVHSDLKPSNVFICPDQTVKLLDFGIARASAAARSNAVARDEPAAFAGFTPAYASLEMFTGEPPDPADDIYSLGLVCYELLSGQHPYQRLRAPEALARALQAKPLAKIGRRRCRAVEQAIALRRAQRSPSVVVFARRFRGQTRLTKLLWAVTALAALSTAVATFGYLTRSGPNISFADLPAPIQLEVNQALESGREALLFDDLDGALQFYDRAHTLHPGNAAAIDGLETIVGRVLDAQSAPTDAAAITAELDRIETLLSYAALANDRRLLRRRAALREQLGR